MSKLPEPLLELIDIHFSAAGETILEQVSLTLQEGEHWVLLGPNGSGKSSLLSIAAGYRWPGKGLVKFRGRKAGSLPMDEWRRQFALFFPGSHDSLSSFHPDISALEVTLTGWDGAIALYHDYPESARERAKSLIRNYFLKGEEILSRPYRLLSSGERRKILFLRTLMTTPSFLILDEPFEFLDLKARSDLASIMKSTVSRPEVTGSLTVLHRIEEIPGYVSHAALMKNGKIVYRGELDDIIHSELLTEVYDTPLRAGKSGSYFYCFPADS